MIEEFEKVAARARQRQIDKDVFRYIAASERGDFSTMAEICQYAEGDRELGDAIWDAALELAEDQRGGDQGYKGENQADSGHGAIASNGHTSGQKR